MPEKETKASVLEKLVPVLLVASIMLAFAVGVLWQKVSNLERGDGGVGSLDQFANGEGALGPIQGKLTEEQAEKVPGVSEEDHIKGSKDAKIAFIEYSDLECPFCAQFHPRVRQVLDEYGDDVAWVYRHFPLDAIHSNARSAAEASECVADIGGEDAFWDFIDALFESQTRVSDLISVASDIGINEQQFNDCIESEKFADKVEDQYQGGLSAGITGTPGSFIINEKGEIWLIPGALPLESLKQTIDEALGS